ncbi:MAG: amidase [Acidobacteriota bacterium]|nr:amidase [Acidobacteriota bacterium]
MPLPPGPLHVIHQALRAGRLSATTLVGASLERLEATSDLNVMADRCFDQALAQAARLDESGEVAGPLWAIPTLVKDLEDWAGLPTRKGSLALRDAPNARETSPVPRRLADAGAIVVGKSTLPEFAIEGYTANRLTGVTRNPWNLDYSPGGSSGGSAAALAAGLVGIATATDGGGSIRIPASLCGLVGLKPSNGAFGAWPAPDWLDYSTDGPFATTSDDLALLFEVTRGPVAGDPKALLATPRDQWPHFEDVSMPLFAAERTSPFGPLPDAVAAQFRDAVEAFATRLGAPVTWLEPTSFFASGDPDLDWFTVTTAEHVAALEREWVETHFDEFHVSTQEFFAAGLAVSIDDYLNARRRRYEYVRVLDQRLSNGGLLLTPTVAAEGWLADGRMPGAGAGAVHGLAPEVYSTALQNITGHPALTLPFGHLPSGLPFGLQVTAERGHDYRLLELARVMEETYPWARVAPGYAPLDAILDGR